MTGASTLFGAGMKLRPYQTTLISDVRSAWAGGARNVLMRLDTGGGKTVILSTLINEHPGASAVIAHRHELVSQLSLTLARHGVRHNIIASDVTRRACAAAHLAATGRSYFDPGARCAVASVDTLVKADGLAAWAAQVTLWIVDEGHHLVLDNKWHTAVSMFTHPQCHGLQPTATPSRADGKGLGSHADGVADVMVEGPPMRWLIEQGYLTDYRLVCPTSDLAVLAEVGASGDWSPKQLKEAAERSHIVGDVVKEYLAFGRGKLGCTFATDIETATKITAEFRAAGVRAELLTGKTDAGFRVQILKRYARREIDQLVTVDIVSEGFDLPAIEILNMARPTQSLGLFMQQFGRALRPIYADGYDLETQEGRLAAIAYGPKPRAIVVDQVGNTIRHQGPPDKPRVWTLDRRDKKAKSKADSIPLRTCVGEKLPDGSSTGCLQPYEAFHRACPYCGVLPPPPAARSAPEFVDGDLQELDAETLARLRGQVVEATMSIDEYRVSMVAKGARPEWVMSNVKHHAAKLEAQAGLQAAMENYVRRCLAEGLRDREIHRKFFLQFGVDVMSARTLNRADTEALTARVFEHG